MRKTLLPVQNYDAHSGPINLVPLLELVLQYTLPFPICNLVHVQFIRSFVFTIPYESVYAVTRLNCLYFGGFFAGNFFRHFHADIWQILLSSFRYEFRLFL